MALRRDQLKGLDYWRLDFPTGSRLARAGNLTYDQVWTRNGYRYYEGPKGLGVYTVQPDEGWYYVFHGRKAGPGQLKGTWDGTYAMVPRFTTKRKSKKSAIDRAYALAYGRSRQPLNESAPKNDNHPNAGFCLSEKKLVIISHWSEAATKSGRSMLRGQCPDCGTEVSKLGNLIECPGCDSWQPEKKGDYLCKVCRWNEKE